jgi:hypothetical protein
MTSVAGPKSSPASSGMGQKPRRVSLEYGGCGGEMADLLARADCFYRAVSRSRCDAVSVTRMRSLV